MAEKNHEVIGFGFPRAHLRRLREKAEEENRSVSGLVRLLVLRYLGLTVDKAKEEKADSVLHDTEGVARQ